MGKKEYDTIAPVSSVHVLIFIKSWLLLSRIGMTILFFILKNSLTKSHRARILKDDSGVYSYDSQTPIKALLSINAW
jgi:hypothetical protein